MVRRLRAAGAILIGKTNLDQFATGLVGTRSPHGAVANAFRPEYISGGSSSGSASVVARGLAAFSLGTDTAGSGRVPAGFNNIVGLKPTRGWLSAAGVVPACRTLDCVSVFALTVDDALRVADIAGGYDARDPSRPVPAGTARPWPARPRFAVPDKLEFHGDAEAEAAFDAALLEVRATGAELRTVDFSPYAELAALLYQGPWVAERFAAVEACGASSRARSTRWCAASSKRPGATARWTPSRPNTAARAGARHPAVAGGRGRAAGAHRAVHLHHRTAARGSAGAQFAAGPLYQFANLADLCALALPAGMRGDGLPAGITVLGLAWQDHALAEFGRRWQARLGLPLGATGKRCPPRRRRVIRRRACCAWPWWARTSAACR